MLYNSVNSAEFARVTHAGEQAMLANAIQDPTLTLYSPTFANRNANIQTDFLLFMTDIVVGRPAHVGVRAGRSPPGATRAATRSATSFQQALAQAPR